MTSRKANDISHPYSPAVSCFQQATIGDGFVSRTEFCPASLKFGFRNRRVLHRARGRDSSQITFFSKASSSSDIFSFRCVGGLRSCPANQAEGRRCRPVLNGEHVFPTVHQNSATALRLRHARFGRARPRQNWLTAPTSANGPRNSGWLASVSRPSMPSWSSCKRFGRASALEEYPERGVRYSSQGSLRKGRRHFGADDRSHAALSARPAGFSSGDGLGIQQPGSMTRGGFFIATAPSGRARKRAICPAVARFNLRRAA